MALEIFLTKDKRKILTTIEFICVRYFFKTGDTNEKEAKMSTVGFRLFYTT